MTDKHSDSDSGTEGRKPKATAEKPEDMFKLSLLSMEKRFLDMEFAISEVAARVKDVDPEGMKALGDRIGALEDMITVEQAGILELKRIMQGVDQSFQSIASAKDVEEARGLAKRAESLARAAAEMADLPAELGEETKKRLKALEDGVSELKRNVIETVSPAEVVEIRRSLGSLDERTTMIGASVDELKVNMEKRMREVKGAHAAVDDIGFINAKIDSLRKAVDSLSGKRIENELKIAQLEQRLAEVLSSETQGGPMAEKVIEEMRGMRRELEGARIRMDAVERVVKKTAKTAQDAEAAARRFEGFEKLSRLQNDIDEKLRQFKFVQDELGGLSNRIENMYEGVDKKFAELRTAKREIGEMGRTVADARKEIEEVRAGLKRAASKEDLAEVAIGVEEVSRLEGNMEKLESHVRKIDMAYSRSETQAGMSAEVLAIMKEMGDRLENAEAAITDMRKAGGAVPAAGQLGMQNFEGRMSDIVDKLVFLESRLNALESIFQTSSRTQAVIIE